MDEDQIRELELHVAAGTDVWTALAALPRKPQERPNATFWIALPIAVLVAWWLLR